MSEMSARPPPGPSRMEGPAGVLRISMLFILSAVSGCAVPQPDTKQAQTYFKGRQNYCLGNMASLGTGLVRAPVPVETKRLSYNARRWTGWVRASASGNYEFSLPDNGGRIIINQQQIFVRPASFSKPNVHGIELLTNRFYAITVETLNSEDAAPSLQWRRPDGRREAVPKAYLYAPVATAKTARTI